MSKCFDKNVNYCGNTSYYVSHGAFFFFFSDKKIAGNDDIFCCEKINASNGKSFKI